MQVSLILIEIINYCILTSIFLPTCLRKRIMKVNMTKFIYKIIFFIIFILILIYFFRGLSDFKEKILSLQKYSNTLNSNIVILTGGSNRIKDGLKIINNVDKFAKANLKILISGTGKGFTKTSLETMRDAVDQSHLKFLYYDGSSYNYVKMSDRSLRFKEIAFGVYSTKIQLTEQLS